VLAGQRLTSLSSVWYNVGSGSALGSSVGRPDGRQLHLFCPIAVGSYTPGPAL
jgi:hypothetical protein